MKIKILCAAVVLNLCLTFACLCRTFPSQNLNFDYLGVIVGILSLLVTVLIGWNIYTMIDVNQYRMNIIKLKNDIDQGLHRNMAVTDGSLYMLYQHVIFEKPNAKAEESMLRHGLCALFHASTFHDIETCNTLVKGLLENLGSDVRLSISESCKRDCRLLLSRTKHTEDIVDFDVLYSRVMSLRTNS